MISARMPGELRIGALLLIAWLVLPATPTHGQPTAPPTGQPTAAPATATPSARPPTATPAQQPSAPSPASQPSGQPSAARRERLVRWVTLWKSRRVEHRKLRLLRLRHRLQAMFVGKPLPPEVLADLRLHARRMARLKRIKQLCIEQEDDPSLERVERLLAGEQARQQRRLSELAASARSTEQPDAGKDGGE